MYAKLHNFTQVETIMSDVPNNTQIIKYIATFKITVSVNKVHVCINYHGS